MTTEELKALPKVELHCHLDGSLSREFIESRLGRQYSQKNLAYQMTAPPWPNTLRNFPFPDSALWMRRD